MLVKLTPFSTILNISGRNVVVHIHIFYFVVVVIGVVILLLWLL